MARIYYFMFLCSVQYMINLLHKAIYIFVLQFNYSVLLPKYYIVLTYTTSSVWPLATAMDVFQCFQEANTWQIVSMYSIQQKKCAFSKYYFYIAVKWNAKRSLKQYLTFAKNDK